MELRDFLIARNIRWERETCFVFNENERFAFFCISGLLRREIIVVVFIREQGTVADGSSHQRWRESMARGTSPELGWWAVAPSPPAHAEGIFVFFFFSFFCLFVVCVYGLSVFFGFSQMVFFLF